MEYTDPESEKSIIRTLLLEPNLVGQIIVELESSDFSNETYKTFYRCIIDLFRSNKKIGIPEVCIITGESQKITEGWIHSEYTSGAHLDSYVESVKRMSAIRQIKAKAMDSSDIREIIELSKQLESKLETRRLPDFSETIIDYEKHIEEKKERLKKGKGIGVTTGFRVFDEKVCLEPTHLVTLAAKSSIGKSALALNVAVNAAMFEQNVLFFSVEMREESLMDRICSILTGVSIGKFKYCNAENSYPLAKLDFKELEKHLKLQYMPRCTSDDVCSLSRKEASTRQIDLVVVDYLQYLSDKTQKGATTNDRIGEITRKLKQLAGELKCCVLMLSQVNRKAEGMPELEHLRDSGNIEQDSDLVVMLHREDRKSTVAELAVKKAREGEAEVAINLKFNPQTTKFTEL